METLYVVLVCLGPFLGYFLGSWLGRRAVRRRFEQACREAERQAERERATLESYRRNTIPGRRAAASPGGESRGSASASSPTLAANPWAGFHAADTDPQPAVPHVYSTPSLHGHGGEFSGAGASSSWAPSSCSGSDYSSGSSDSSSSSCSSSGSD